VRWPWHKHEVKIVYVPVPSYGEYKSLWSDQGYLGELVSVSSSMVWTVEMVQLLKEARDALDVAKTVEEIKGISECIKLIKMRVTINSSAKNILKSLRAQEEINKETE
jgi:hypothetical protein